MKKMQLTGMPMDYIWLFGSFLVIFFAYLTFSNHRIIEKEEPVIVWQDEALGDAVKNNMWLSEDAEVPISQAEKFNFGMGYDTAGSTTMLLEGKNIKQLDDLQYFTSQVNLTIRNTSVTDFSPLEKMDKLRKLSIEGGDAINLEPLQRLEKLLILELSNMPDAIIPSLENLKQLTYLSLDGMSLENLSTIGPLRGVLYLIIKNTNIKNTSALSDFGSLNCLVIDNCPIETLPRLSGSLEILELRRTAITDLSSLPQETWRIEIVNNDIDFQTLDGINNLTILRIYDIDLSNISESIFLPNLSSLKLINCKLERFNFVRGSELESLDLSRNKIKKISDIENIKNVIAMNLSCNELVDLEGIEKALNLVSLNLTENKITNIDALKKMDTLTEVDLSGNPISVDGGPGLDGNDEH